MTGFLLLAAGMTALAVGVVVLPLLRVRAEASRDRDALNTAIHRERLAELDAEYPESSRDQPAYREARDELLAALGRDVEASPGYGAPDAGRFGPVVAAAVAAALPVAAFTTYLLLGEVALLTDAGTPPAGETRAAVPEAHPPIEEMVDRLERRLAENPGDVEGWLLLARTHAGVGRLDRVVSVLEQANSAVPGNPGIMVNLAEALARANGNNLRGRPAALLRKVLANVPDHRKGLWLGGLAALHEGDPADALSLWARLRDVSQMSEEESQILDRLVQQARAQLEAAGPAAGRSPQAAPSPVAVSASQGAVAGARLQVSVSVSSTLAAAASPSDTVFVFARAHNGPRIPLAVVRKRVADLPFVVTLDDTMAMTPALKLSAFEQVVVGARISRTGRATPTPGDLFGESSPVVVSNASEVHIDIDQTVR